MRRILLFLGILLSFASCSFNTQDTLRGEVVLESAKRHLFSLADTSHLVDTSVSALLNPLVLDAEGQVKSVKMGRALELYNFNTGTNKANQFPIFEVRNSNKVILPFYGKGLWASIWADVLLDKDSMKIVDIRFDHFSETPGMGAEITKSSFSTQFVQAKLSVNAKSFGLFQDGKESLKGPQRIDGISGATETSKGAVTMLNNGLLKYQKYLEPK